MTNIKKSISIKILLAFLIFINSQNIFACSGYKITIGDRTFLGSNHDAWFITPHIWFETANSEDKYGAASNHSFYNNQLPNFER